MAENHNVVVELGSVIQDRGEWDDLAQNAKLYMNNIVQYGKNAYRVKAVPVAGYLTKDVLPTNTTYYTLFAGVGELATGEDFINPDATNRAKIPTVGAVLDGMNATAGVNRSGTFAEKPSSEGIYVGFAYFCTDKQTTEGATDGIILYHKGNNVWVDALGRVVS